MIIDNDKNDVENLFNSNYNKFLLFDVDGTLTLPREKIENSMIDSIKLLQKKGYKVGVVGGGTIAHIKDQLENLTYELDYVFSENGTNSFKKNLEMFHNINIKQIIGEKLLKEIINFSLKYMANISLPFKRGTFFELRSGIINICPMGRNCTYNERLQFIEYDHKHNILSNFRNELEKKFISTNNNIVFSIGSSVSIDMFLEQHRKPYCLKFLDEYIGNIIFFGDKTNKGGNDYEISIDSRIKKSFTVLNPKHLESILKSIDNYFKS